MIENMDNKKIKQEPFTQYNDREDKKKLDTFTIRLNEAERKELEWAKKILEQTKDSTALKQLASIGANVLHEEKIATLLGAIFKNKRNNKRLGLHDFE